MSHWCHLFLLALLLLGGVSFYPANITADNLEIKPREYYVVLQPPFILL